MNEAATCVSSRPRTSEVIAPMPNQHTKNPIPVPERFWSKVDFAGPAPAHRPELGPCWLWTANKDRLGYPSFRFGGRMMRAHRWAYEFCVGPIPEGLTIDHLCLVRHCVRPDHLEPVSLRTNILRSPNALAAINARKTHCEQGHPFDDTRVCRECTNRRERGYYWQQKRKVQCL